MGFWTVLLFACAAPVLGQVPVPEQLKTLLAHARSHSREHPDTRGATPDFANIKKLLREWIESRLPPLTRSDQEIVTAFQLTAELAKAGLVCRYDPQGEEVKCPDQDPTGFLGNIKLHQSPGFLVVETGVGIQCGYDESAYIYQWKDDRWQRFWETEQNDYTKDKYLPQYLRQVRISPADYRPQGDNATFLIATVGTQPPWCESNWYPIYYRFWQTKAGAPAKPLLDENETGRVDEPIGAAVWPDNVLIEYTVAARDGLRRRQVRHYHVAPGKIERIDPVALSPSDFVLSWVDGPSKEAIERSAPSVRAALEVWRRKVEDVPDFIDPTCRCKQRPDLWQVGMEDAQVPPRPRAYFLIRWRPPYHFSMVGVSTHPWPDCIEKDPEADEFRALFPESDYR